MRHVSAVELGKVAASVLIVARIAEALGVTADELLKAPPPAAKKR